MAVDNFTVGTGTVGTGTRGTYTLTKYISSWDVTETAGATATENIRDSLAVPSAPTAVDGAAGNSTAGLHMFAWTWVTREGESDIGALVELTTAGSVIMTVSAPVYTHGSFVVGRNLYMTKAGAPTTGVTPTNAQYFLVTGVGLSTVAPATTIASGSNALPLPQGTINVATTADFKPTTNGNILVATSAGLQVVTYATQTGTTFAGCTGGVGIMSTGGAVTAGVLADATTTSISANLADGSLGSVHPPTVNKSGLIMVPTLNLSANQSVGSEYANPRATQADGGVVIETVTGTTRFTVAGA